MRGRLLAILLFALAAAGFVDAATSIPLTMVASRQRRRQAQRRYAGARTPRWPTAARCVQRRWCAGCASTCLRSTPPPCDRFPSGYRYATLRRGASAAERRARSRSPRAQLHLLLGATASGLSSGGSSSTSARRTPSPGQTSAQLVAQTTAMVAEVSHAALPPLPRLPSAPMPRRSPSSARPLRRAGQRVDCAGAMRTTLERDARSALSAVAYGVRASRRMPSPRG